MNHDPEDPRLTAYALGELPPREAQEVEALIAASPEAMQEVEEIRGFAGLLTEVFEREAASKPAPDLEAAVVNTCESRSPLTPALSRRTGEGGRRPGEGDSGDSSPCIPATRDTEALEAVPASSADAGEEVPVTEGEDKGRIVPMPARPSRWRLGLGLGLGLAASVSLLTLPWWLPTRAPRDAVKQMAARGNETKAEVLPDASSSAAMPVVPEVRAGAEPEESTTGPVLIEAPAPAGELAAAAAIPERKDAPKHAEFGGNPELMRRYGLMPTTPHVPDSRPSPVAGSQPTEGPQTFSMSPELMKRYGLATSPAPAPTSAPGSASEPSSSRLALSKDSAPLMRSRYGGVEAPAPSASAPASGRAVRFRQGLVSDPYRRAQPLVFMEPQVEDRSGGGNNPGYVDAGDNAFESPLTQPLSTFGLDVDTGSYANVRRFLNAGTFPPRAAVRIEEMINYFPYAHSEPVGDDVFGARADVAMCPWEPRHRLVRIALKARAVIGEPPVANLVFLVDVSGSMQPSERLPLLKQALRALTKRLAPSDRVAIVTYATKSGVHLPSTSAEEKDRILEAIDSLASGGTTNGEGGIRRAYILAREHFIPGGVNRVLLCTDGDFNVGLSDQDELVRLIEGEAKSGVFLTTLGVGTDNFKDALMRRLADKGNGSYHYLDSHEEARRVLIEQKDATFVTVARDAKAQVEFNPGNVAAWRLIGYEKRLMPAEDFNDDTKDAGEVGAGQTVTVLYEIVPVGVRPPGSVDPLKYQPVAAEPTPERVFARSPELLTVKLRYQRPEGSKSVLKEIAVADREREPDADFKFAAAVAAFGMALRDPSWNGGRGFDTALTLAQSGLGEDPGGWRAEFLTLVRKARGIRR